MFHFLPVEWHDSLPSTNTWLLDRVKARPETSDGTVVAAREQTAGRGRQQRRWVTQSGRNLTFSFLWNSTLPPERVPCMAQAISVGIAAFLASHGLAPAIKWPNDVQVGGKKIGGILCERVNNSAPHQTAIVAGIGINVNMGEAEAAAIDQPATSLRLVTEKTWDVEAVLDSLLVALLAPLNAWATGGFAGIEPAYVQYAPPIGSRVRVRDGQTYIEGTLAGFNAHGALRLETPDQGERIMYSGDLEYS